LNLSRSLFLNLNYWHNGNQRSIAKKHSSRSRTRAMSRLIKRCIDALCSLPFQVNRYDGLIDSVMSPGVIACPHCGTEQPGDSNAVFLTHALSAEEEEEFMRQESIERMRKGE
jgi:hypothetical protein